MAVTILCPIDFSDDSIGALEYALNLAEDARGNVTILHSYRLIQTDREEEILSFKKKKESETLKKFEELEQRLVNLKKIGHKFVNEIGFLSDSIENHLRKNPVSMLVMSQKMCSSLNDHRGYPMEMFLNRITVPVVIVPDKVPVADNY